VRTLEKAVIDRATGEQVSRTRSFVAAAIAGFATAAVTYRVLRSGSKEGEEES
jgi:hypothetical protein